MTLEEFRKKHDFAVNMTESDLKKFLLKLMSMMLYDAIDGGMKESPNGMHMFLEDIKNTVIKG